MPFCQVEFSSPDYPYINFLSRDVRNSEDIPATFQLLCSGQGKLLWRPSLMPAGNFTLNHIQDMKVDSSYEFTDGERVTIVYSQPGLDLFTISLSAGWNLLSLPVIPVSGDLMDIFSFVSTPPYRYLPEERSYQMFTSARGGIGFFLLSMVDTTFQISGVSVDSVVVPITEGWNLIGVPNTGFSLPVSAIESEPEGILIPDNIFYYSTESGAYELATSLVSGRGYWVLSESVGILIIRRTGR